MSSHQSKPSVVGKSKYTGVARNSGAGALRFGQVSGETLRECVDTVVAGGDAVLFGRTSDGGALSVRVLSNGVTEAWYPSDASELQELLEALIAINQG